MVLDAIIGSGWRSSCWQRSTTPSGSHCRWPLNAAVGVLTAEAGAIDADVRCGISPDQAHIEVQLAHIQVQGDSGR